MSETSRPAEKPTSEWVTGDEPMTGPQESYLQTLAREAGEEVPAGLTKAQASEQIERLQAATGRGTDSSGAGGGGASGGAGASGAGGGASGAGGGASGAGGGASGAGGAGGAAAGAGASASSGQQHLGEKAEEAGIVDQQAALLDQIEDAGSDATQPVDQT